MILEISFLMPYSLSSFISKVCPPLVRNRKKQALRKIPRACLMCQNELRFY